MIENIGVISEKFGKLQKQVLKVVFKEAIDDKKKKAEFVAKYFENKWIVKYMGWGRMPIRGKPIQMDLFRFYDRPKKKEVDKKVGKKR